MRSDNGWTALAWAVDKRQEEISDILRAAGKDNVSKQTEKKLTYHSLKDTFCRVFNHCRRIFISFVDVTIENLFTETINCICWRWSSMRWSPLRCQDGLLDDFVMPKNWALGSRYSFIRRFFDFPWEIAMYFATCTQKQWCLRLTVMKQVGER